MKSPRERAKRPGLPPEIRTAAQQTLAAFCDRRVPPHVRKEVRLDVAFRGCSVTLYEVRPVWLPAALRPRRTPALWTHSPVAQFRYDPESGRWSLYGADRNSRWRPYAEWGGTVESSPFLDTLLIEVDRDPTGIFWG